MTLNLKLYLIKKKRVKLRARQAISSPSLQVQKTARNTANHQRHPSLSLCLWPSLSLVLSAIPHPLRIPTAPCGNEGHIAFWEKLSAKIPSGHGPTPPHTQLPQKSCPVSSKYSPGLQGTTQPKITGHISTFICIPEQAQTLQQQLLDHSQAQIEFWKVAIVGTPPFPSSDTSTDGARLGWECHARCGWQNCPLAVLQLHTNIQVKEKDNVICA